nr:hypothetical protein [Tanacetum cinerariifolium]
MDHKVKTIRCDNETEFKNRIMNEFCEMKGIRREFSVAKTPQQNGLAERKNRVLVIKPHNKTPYELFLGRKPTLSFMRPFGCPVTILNTLDHLGNQTNGNAGTKANIDAGQARKKTILDSQYDPTKEGDKNDQENDLRGQEEAFRKQLEQESKRLFSQGAANTNNTNRLNTVSSLVNAVSSSFTTADPGRERAQRNNAGGSNYVNLGGLILINAATLPNDDLPTDPIIPDLKDTADLQDTRIFSGAYDDEVEGVEADFKQLKTHHICYTQEEGIDYDKVFALVAKIEAIRLFLAYASYMGFIVYQENSKNEKRVMDIKEIPKFCDASLKKVLMRVLGINQEVYYGYKDLPLPNVKKKAMELSEREI